MLGRLGFAALRFCPPDKNREGRWEIKGSLYLNKVPISLDHSPICSITACETPVKEKPPSWNRFCMVTILVRSENRVTV